ncbi:MAG: helix-turn-helix domain-containing protein [Prevotella sp.]|nr:helix-turn-helix domain-containing protein [Prevotella sp.]
MREVTMFVQEVLPVFENWIRTTISDEVSKVLEADRQKQKPSKKYTRKEVSKMASISLPTLWQKTKNGEINATHIGRRVLYDEAEVKRFLGQ